MPDMHFILVISMAVVRVKDSMLYNIKPQYLKMNLETYKEYNLKDA